jgi:hypothetical protein
MQPYLFPYIGYFQLINAVDTFVIYDDVNYIKQGWINRNYILLNGKKHLVTLALSGASSFKLINEIRVGTSRSKFIRTVEQAYRKASFFDDVFSVIQTALDYEDNNLARFVSHALLSVSAYLKIDTKFMMSSDIKKDDALKGQDKILQICKTLGADVYINAIGGRELYSSDEFDKHSIKLYFMKTNDITYRQFDNEFVSNLSIIDTLMFNSRETVTELLNEYELVQ